MTRDPCAAPRSWPAWIWAVANPSGSEVMVCLFVRRLEGVGSSECGRVVGRKPRIELQMRMQQWECAAHGDGDAGAQVVGGHPVVGEVVLAGEDAQRQRERLEEA